MSKDKFKRIYLEMNVQAKNYEQNMKDSNKKFDND